MFENAWSSPGGAAGLGGAASSGSGNGPRVSGEVYGDVDKVSLADGVFNPKKVYARALDADDVQWIVDLSSGEVAGPVWGDAGMIRPDGAYVYFTSSVRGAYVWRPDESYASSSTALEAACGEASSTGGLMASIGEALFSCDNRYADETEVYDAIASYKSVVGNLGAVVEVGEDPFDDEDSMVSVVRLSGEWVTVTSGRVRSVAVRATVWGFRFVMVYPLRARHEIT